MAQVRNDAGLSVAYVPDYATDIAAPGTTIDIGTGAEDANFVNLIGAKATEELNTITGWEVQSSSIPLEGYAGPEVGSLAGAQTYPESSLRWLSDNASNTLFDLVDPDSDPGTAAIVFGRFGEVVGGFYELFPVEVASRVISKGRNVPATFQANFSLNAPLTGTFSST